MEDDKIVLQTSSLGSLGDCDLAEQGIRDIIASIANHDKRIVVLRRLVVNAIKLSLVKRGSSDG